MRIGADHRHQHFRLSHALEAILLTRTLPLIAGLVDGLHAGIDLLDVGCGEGVAIQMLAQRFPRSRFVGLDIATDAIQAAQVQTNRTGLTNARFLVQDPASFAAPSAFDSVTTFDAIHDQAAPRRVVRGIREALRPGGVFLLVDIAVSSHLERNLDNPLAPFLYTVSTMHCTTVSLAQGGEGLEVSRVESDPFNAYYVCRP